METLLLSIMADSGPGTPDKSALVILIGSIVVAASMVIPSINIVVGWIKGPAKSSPATMITPQPLIVRNAEEYATQGQVAKIETDLRNQMTELRAYMHDALHQIKGEAHATNGLVRNMTESTRELFGQLDARNEQRVEKVHNRINEIIDHQPEKIINLLRNTGALRP